MAIYRESYRTIGRTVGKGVSSSGVHEEALLTQIILDENQAYIATEEGYLMVEEDNEDNFIVEE